MVVVGSIGVGVMVKDKIMVGIECGGWGGGWGEGRGWGEGWGWAEAH